MLLTGAEGLVESRWYWGGRF